MKKKLTEEQKEARRLYLREWRKKHPEKVKEQREKRAEYQKQWWKDNTDKVAIYRENGKEQRKVYRESHKEEISAAKKKCYGAKKEEYLRKGKEYRDTHKEEKSARDKRYREEHKEEIAIKNKERDKIYRWTIRGRASKLVCGYKRYDKKYGLETDVDQDWVAENILTDNKCVYCGDEDYKHLGCDRVDNTLGHIKTNVVCSCSICNIERHLKDLSVEEMKEYRNNNPLPKWDLNGNKYDG